MEGAEGKELFGKELEKTKKIMAEESALGKEEGGMRGRHWTREEGSSI